jgi:hypothetical protein
LCCAAQMTWQHPTPTTPAATRCVLINPNESSLARQ